MHIAVLADAVLRREFEQKGIPGNVNVQFISAVLEVTEGEEALFYLCPETDLEQDLAEIGKLEIPVFVNALVTPLSRLPANCIRINGWPGFFERGVTEVSSTEKNVWAVNHVFNTLGWKFAFVPDITGMVSARIIAMIINEAYFALEDNVASRADIDIAMNLGTNYPYGPFEWLNRLGLQNVVHLLKTLSEEDHIYSPSPALLKEKL